MANFRFHHVAISVADVERSAAFYNFFGFNLALKWRADDGSLVLAHFLHPTGSILEVVRYAAHVAPERLPGVGNDLDRIGVKHLALHTDDDLDALHDEITSTNLGEATAIQNGRTGFRLFFVRDPDGYWVEVLQDKRSLDVNDPTDIVETPRFLPGE